MTRGSRALAGVVIKAALTVRSVDPDDEIVGRRAVAAVDDLDDVITELPELAAVFAIGRDRPKREARGSG
jgi:hypothetical protein